MQSLVWSVLVLLTLGVAVGVAWWVDGRERWLPALRHRFYYGVPWGTLVSVALVLSVYLLLQGGLRDWHDPVVLPFRAWSYLYPTGLLTAGFAHSSPGHLLSNLFGTVVLAPIAEYAWGHYPPGWDGTEQSEDGTDLGSLPDRVRGWLRTPWIRAFVAFPGAVVAIGIATALFAIGPVIGFSGVVFAFGGFALVRYPLGTLVAVLATGAVSRTYYAIRDPVVFGEVTGSAPSAPWWADIAVQGHALGILIGVLLGLLLLWHRDIRPDAGRILLATFVYATRQNLWAIYLPEGDGTFVLYRGLGIALVAILALVITVAAASGDRPLRRWLDTIPGRPTVRQVGIAWLLVVAITPLVATLLAALAGGPIFPVLLVTIGLGLIATLPALVLLLPLEWEGDPVTGRGAAIVVVLLATVLIGGMAVVPNLVTVSDEPVPEDRSLSVEGYDVTYAEGVRDQRVPAIDIPFAADATNVTASGVIVVDPDRHIWSTAVSRQFLASEGDASVTLGGVGWRERVDVQRRGWNVAGNDTVYDVTLHHGEESVRAFASNASRADPVLANHTVAVEAAEEGFRLRVFRDNESIGTAEIPEVGNESSLGALTIRTVREDDRLRLRASVDGTDVGIAQRETYRES